MPMNRVQFQPGLSMPEFLTRYGTDAQCEAALQAARWPKGFVCPNCGGELVRRPRRPAAALARHPASTERVFNPAGCAQT